MRRILKALVMSWLPRPARRWVRLRKRGSRSNDHRDPAFVTVTPQLVFETLVHGADAEEDGHQAKRVHAPTAE